MKNIKKYNFDLNQFIISHTDSISLISKNKIFENNNDENYNEERSNNVDILRSLCFDKFFVQFVVVGTWNLNPLIVLYRIDSV